MMNRMQRLRDLAAIGMHPEAAAQLITLFDQAITDDNARTRQLASDSTHNDDLFQDDLDRISVLVIRSGVDHDAAYDVLNGIQINTNDNRQTA